MLDNETKRRIDTARDVLVGKVPDPKSQVEQITIALIYKFMDDMDHEAVEMGGKAGFFVGDYQKYAWSKIFAPQLGGFEMLALYADAITRMAQNPNLPQLFRDIFKNAYLPYRDPETLKLFLKTINEFSYDHSECLGDAFEYLLSVLGSQGDAGQFRTPRHIIDFMVQVVAPQKNETILDPACGTAGFLISSFKYILKDNTKKIPGDRLTTSERKKLLTNFKGYDISPDMVRLSLVNLYLHGFVQPQILEYDTLSSEDRWNEYADVIMANPPFMSPKGGIKPHKKFSVQSNRSEVLFVDYIAEHLRPTGRAAVIVPEGIIFQSAGAYKQLRKMLVEKYLYAVVSLPAGVFNPYSGVKTSIIFLDVQLSRKTDAILFVKIENDGFGLGAQRREITGSDLPNAANVLADYIKAVRSGACHFDEQSEGKVFNVTDKPCCALLVKKEKLAENGEYNLTGERYRIAKRKVNQKWPMVKLGDVCDVRDGTHDSPKYVNNNGFPLITSKNVKDGYIDYTEVNLISKEDLDKINERSLVENGDIIMPMIGTIGNPIIVNKDREFAIKNVALIKFTSDTKVNNYFIKDLLDSELLKKHYQTQSSGSTQKFISLGFIRNLEIPLPPLEVQHEIVKEIEGYQKLIDGARQVVENWKPQIDIDPEWPMVKLGDVSEINPKKSEVSSVGTETLVSFLPMEDIGMDQDILPKKNKKLGDVYKGYTFFRDNDVLVAKVTPCFENGKGGIARRLLNGIGFGSSELHVIRSSEKILPEFIYPFISSRKFLIVGKSKMTGTGGLQRVPSSYILEFEIPLPALEIQREIVSKIEAERKAVAVCRELIAIYEAKIKQVIDKVWED